MAVGGSFKETDTAMVDCVSSSTGMGEGVVFVTGSLVVGEGVVVVFVVGLGVDVSSSGLGATALSVLVEEGVVVGSGLGPVLIVLVSSWEGEGAATDVPLLEVVALEAEVALDEEVVLDEEVGDGAVSSEGAGAGVGAIVTLL